MTDASTPATLDFDRALRHVRALVPETPLLEVPELSERLGAPVHLKLENLQVTGSFKVRGAAGRMGELSDEERARGVIACSSGNHGRAVAWVAERSGIPAVVCVPDWVDPVKLDAIRSCGAEAVLAGPTYDAAAERSVELAEERGLTVVHPFDDPRVAAGQGTVALEILERLPDVGTVVIPLSGGGLAGGMAAALKDRRRAGREEAGISPEIRVVAASAARARVMLESLGAGQPLEMAEEETLASALSGGIELENRVTFDLVRHHVDEHVVVDEDAIGRTMAHAHRALHLVVEGGGAVGLAALLEGMLDVPDGRPVVVVISGGNVSETVLREVLEAHPPG